ncbi:alpha/beta-hydrolase [Zopfia rhizophila CBS 207.26]|uniref:S-formylglutathione hydrolase n=1 Tax=Zopfia rhizophila CBS 207.26 TaxID=1314779 RepID=A0A6A6DQ81_9PEZI|nr:alpha/beta-hydrolase [Zopfia rhizophila CBS 207.26]
MNGKRLSSPKFPSLFTIQNVVQINATIAPFGGKTLSSNTAKSTNCEMNLSLYLPPQATSSKKVPVLFYLFGLTCTSENCSEKGQKGIAVVYPDTSPLLSIPDEDDVYDFESGVGFHIDATKEPWTKGYNMYTYITSELPDVLFNTFDQLDGSRTSITGHSMSGHGALTLHWFFKYTGKYKSCSAFAPIANPINCQWGQKDFNGCFGAENNAKSAGRNGAGETAEGALGAAVRRRGGQQLLQAGSAATGELLKAAKDNGNDEGVSLRFQTDYVHSYYFMVTFADEHVEWATKHLGMW